MAFTIEQGKETGVVPYGPIPKPLVLCEITAVDGDVCRFSTTPSLGAIDVTYNGNTYQSRLVQNTIEQIQALSQQGYDIPGSISLEIADGDFEIWNNHANSHGWRGGTVKVIFLLWDIPTNAFSTNYYSWDFILDKPNITGNGILTVSAQARQSLTRLFVPNFPNQNRCSFQFPSTAAQRLDGLINPFSPYWGCGYSPDQGGPGNRTTANLTDPNGDKITDGNGLYVMCDYTRSCGSGKKTLTQGCMARLGNYSGTLAPDGDITKDQQGNATARFPGNVWLAPQGWGGTQYTNPGAAYQYGFNTPNPATGTTFYNIGYGSQFVDATVLAPAGDPNSDRAECVVCMAPVQPATVKKVIANGVDIPFNSSDVTFTFRVMGAADGSRRGGGRNGYVNGDKIYDSKGDPHGSQCVIEVVILSQLAAPGSIPSVQVLVDFPNCLHAYEVTTATSNGANTDLTFGPGATNIDITVGMTIYVSGNSGVPDGSYVTSAVAAGPPGVVTIPGGWSGTGGAVFYLPLTVDVGYSDGVVSVPGLDANLTSITSANPVWVLMDLLAIWGPFVLSDFDVPTWYNAASICAQQISYTDINGNSATHARFRCSLCFSTSNRQTFAQAVLSIRNCAGIVLSRNPSNGKLQCNLELTVADQQPDPIDGSNFNSPYPSMRADGTGANGYLAYVFDGANSIVKDSLKLEGRSLNDTANTVAFSFQDSANVWVVDSLTLIDPDGYVSSGNQRIDEQLQVMGIDNFDQAIRRANVELSKALYGNNRFDAGGTEFFSFTTTAKAAHLASRVGCICAVNYDQLGMSNQLVRLMSAAPGLDGESWTLQFRFHQDIWYTDAYGQDPAPFQRAAQLGRHGGLPYPWKPGLNLSSGQNTFNFSFDFSNVPGTINIFGNAPVNVASTNAPPQVPLFATTANTGGSILPGAYYVILSSGGLEGPISILVHATVPQGTNTNTITISKIYWPSGTTSSMSVYMGPDILHMTYQSPGVVIVDTDANGNPTTVMLTAYNTTFSGLPDPNFFGFEIQQTEIAHGGVWGEVISKVTLGQRVGNTWPMTLTFNDAQWTDSQWVNYTIVLYFRANANPQPIATAKIATSTLNTLEFIAHSNQLFKAGDVVVMRAMSSSITVNTIGDPNFVNWYGQNGLTVDQDAGNSIMIVGGTGFGSSIKTIASNTATVFTINGTWDIMPDATTVFIVLARNFTPFYTPKINSDGSTATTIRGTFPVASGVVTQLSSASVLIQVATVDVNGNSYPMQYQPFREIYSPPQDAAGNSVTWDGVEVTY